MEIWKLRTIDFKSINQIIDIKFEQKQNETCRKLFNYWKDCIKEKKIEKRNEEIAITFYIKHLMVKIILEWRDYCFNRTLKRLNDQNLIQKFINLKSKLIKNHIYILWKNKCSQTLLEENKKQIAFNLYSHNLKLKFISAWKVYYKFCIRKKLINNQAKWFLEMRLKSDVFCKWTIKYENELANKDKNEKALLLWSINIQKNCLVAWQNWIQFRRQKRERYKQALEIRQLDIIKECSRKFLKFSTDSKVRRLQANRILKEKCLLNSVELETKYFYIWLNKCKFKSLPRREDKKLTKIKNLLSGYNLKKSAILEDISLDKKENISGPTTIFKNLDSCGKKRPAPRKPAFIESIDCNKSNLEAVKIVETIEIDNNKLIEECHLNIPKEVSVSAVLLPPSAFLNCKLISQNDTEISENQFKNDAKNELKSSSMSTICNVEVYKEINFGKSMTNLNFINSSSSTSLNQDIKRNLNRENELVTLKKKLETLTIKSDKLKYFWLNIKKFKLSFLIRRLKEQEKLLINCIKSNEINQTSMCETIYQEIDQVRLFFS